MLFSIYLPQGLFNLVVSLWEHISSSFCLPTSTFYMVTLIIVALKQSTSATPHPTPPLLATV